MGYWSTWTRSPEQIAGYRGYQSSVRTCSDEFSFGSHQGWKYFQLDLEIREQVSLHFWKLHYFLNAILSDGLNHLILRRFKPFVDPPELDYVDKFLIANPPAVYTTTGSTFAFLESSGELVIWNFEIQVVVSWATGLEIADHISEIYVCHLHW